MECHLLPGLNEPPPGDARPHADSLRRNVIILTVVVLYEFTFTVLAVLRKKAISIRSVTLGETPIWGPSEPVLLPTHRWPGCMRRQ